MARNDTTHGVSNPRPADDPPGPTGRPRLDPVGPTPLRRAPPELRARVARLARHNAAPPLGHRPWIRRPIRNVLLGFVLTSAAALLGGAWLWNLGVLVLDGWSTHSSHPWYELLPGYLMVSGIGAGVTALALVAGVRRLRRGLGARRAFLHLGTDGVVWFDGYRVAFAPWPSLVRAETTVRHNEPHLRIVVDLGATHQDPTATWDLPTDAGVPPDILADEIETASRDPTWRAAPHPTFEEPERTTPPASSLDFRCSGCGASLPIAAEEAEVLCAHCGTRSTRSAALEAALEEFRQAAAKTAARLEPLFERVRQLEQDISNVRLCAIVAGGLWAAIFILSGIMNLIYRSGPSPEAEAKVLALLTVGAADVPAMLLLVRWVRRKVTTFRRLVTALPARDAHGTSRCRNCGATLPAQDAPPASDAPHPDHHPASPTPAIDVRRCAWCGIENLVTTEPDTSVPAAPLPNLAERIRSGAPRWMQAEAKAHEAVRLATKAAAYLSIFLFVPDALLYPVLNALWLGLLRGAG